MPHDPVAPWLPLPLGDRHATRLLEAVADHFNRRGFAGADLTPA